MILQTLLEKLLYLRLTAFRKGLQEQVGNSRYADLPFEERLLLLVDLECTHLDDNRNKRRLKLAEFPLTAAIEEIDFSPERGLDRHLILEMAQSTWVDKALNILVLGATGTGKTFIATSLGVAACRFRLFCPLLAHFPSSPRYGSRQTRWFISRFFAIPEQDGCAYFG